jgi:hypothetical protein
MADFINYVASSGGHAYFGMAEDPLTEIAKMQAGSPLPIELVAGWVLSPKVRADLLDQLQHSLRKRKRRGDWIQIDQEMARQTLRRHARRLGGAPWNPPEHPVQAKVTVSEKARAVITPNGPYPSVSAAAEAYGITRQSAWDRANRKSPGWRFADDDRPPPKRASPGRPKLS